MKIGIILGSVRDVRKTEAVAHWIYEAAQPNVEAEWVLLDLRDFDVPLLTSPTSPGIAQRSYDDARVAAWSRAVDECDGFIFVTPEYNHGVPGAFKNAVDSLSPEWYGKAVAFVSHGADGGVRAVENWRVVLSNFQMALVRNVVSLQQFTDWTEGAFTPIDRRTGELDTVISDVVAATRRNLSVRR